MILRNDDLTGVGVVGVFDGVAQDADDPNDLAGFSYAFLDVTRVTDELLAASDLGRRNVNKTDILLEQ